MHHIHVTKHRIRNALSFPMKKPDASRELLEMSLSKEKAILRETAILHDFAGEPLPMAVRELQPLDNTHVEHTIRPDSLRSRTRSRMQRIRPVGFCRTGIKKLLRNLIVPEEFRKTAATYSPTVTQYHRRGEA